MGSFEEPEASTVAANKTCKEIAQMGTVENKETIRRIYAALENGDRSVFGASVQPDYVWRLAGQSSWSKRFEGQEDVSSIIC